jgi:hypothetical protein
MTLGLLIVVPLASAMAAAVMCENAIALFFSRFAMGVQSPPRRSPTGIGRASLSLAGTAVSAVRRSAAARGRNREDAAAAIAWWRTSTGARCAAACAVGLAPPGGSYAAADGRERRAWDYRRARRGAVLGLPSSRDSGHPLAASIHGRGWVLVRCACVCRTMDTCGASGGLQPPELLQVLLDRVSGQNEVGGRVGRRPGRSRSSQALRTWLATNRGRRGRSNEFVYYAVIDAYRASWRVRVPLMV